jgi:hypothetical protein
MIHKAFFGKIFKSLISHSETSRFIGHMFKGVYERIDFNYLDKDNLYKKYVQLKQQISASGN